MGNHGNLFVLIYVVFPLTMKCYIRKGGKGGGIQTSKRNHFDGFNNLNIIVLKEMVEIKEN